MKKQVLTIVIIFLAALVVFIESSFAEGSDGLLDVYRGEEQKSFEGPETWFTGEVQVDMLFPSNETINFSGASVVFQPGARTAWHAHPLGQTLIVTDGSGWIQCWGEPVVEIKKGDSVWIPADVKHWHGATDKTFMTHIAIQGSQKGNPAKWMEHVSDEQFLSGNDR